MAVEKNEESDATIPPQMRDYKFTGPLRPVYPLSEKREVPAHIPRPDYADHRELTSQMNDQLTISAGLLPLRGCA